MRLCLMCHINNRVIDLVGCNLCNRGLCSTCREKYNDLWGKIYKTTRCQYCHFDYDSSCKRCQEIIDECVLSHMYSSRQETIDKEGRCSCDERCTCREIAGTQAQETIGFKLCVYAVGDEYWHEVYKCDDCLIEYNGSRTRII